MTECERIIADGTLPRSFLKEEERDEFLVTEKQKKVWAVELDMLLKFDSICKKHGLTYFLMFGSLLGAIRHQGFIPWDDDVDVGMPRKDYDKLLTLTDEFEMPYFLQTPYTDEGYYYSYAKIRNSNTSGITQQFRFQEINWGLMLDVYPIDNFVLEGAQKRYEQILAWRIKIKNALEDIQVMRHWIRTKKFRKSQLNSKI
jgi:lipopolysaccharide cholinephosphotransferase